MSNQISNVGNCRVYIYGDNNTVEFGKGSRITGDIFIGEPDSICNNCIIKIGEGTTANDIMIRVMEDYTKVTIGNECMFSNNTQIWASDTHSIFDVEGNLMNIGKEVNIGNHVWIGFDVVILKNTYVPNNSVIGINSVVSGMKFIYEGSVIAGNPAKFIKTIGNWSRSRPQQEINKKNK